MIFFISAYRSFKPNQKSFLWWTIRDLGTWSNTSIPLWNTLFYSSFYTQLVNKSCK